MRTFAFSSALMALSLALSASSSGAETCQEIVGNNRYRCQLTSQAGGTGEICIQFVSPGTVSTKFDVIFPGNSSYGCDCKAKGRVNAPKFGTSKEFFCINPGSSTIASAVEGKVSGNGERIKGGFWTDQSHQVTTTRVFACELDPACL